MCSKKQDYVESFESCASGHIVKSHGQSWYSYPPCSTSGKHWLCLKGSFLRVLWLVAIFVTWEIQIFGSGSLARIFFFTYLLFFCAFTYICIFLCVDLLVPYHMCEGQRTTWWTHFFPIFYHMGPEDQTQFLRFGGKRLYQTSSFASLAVCNKPLP